MIKSRKKYGLLCLAFLFFYDLASTKNLLPGSTTLRMDCAVPQATIDLSINNIRTKLRLGGSIWWDNGDGAFIVPKSGDFVTGELVSTIRAGGIWIGGTDPAGNLKIACQGEGVTNGLTDFYAGPLSETGVSNESNCLNWDRFFYVKGEDVELHLQRYEEAIQNGIDYREKDIPDNIKGWPAFGNPFFEAIYGFSLPMARQGLALFFDRTGDGIYDPREGDYPIIDIRGCDRPLYPEEMSYAILNDAGGPHTQTGGDPIQMEVQLQTFSYKSITPANNAVYYRFKTINRAIESIDSFYFGIWMDPELGCPDDDYIGCSPSDNVAYVYNADEIDGDDSGECGNINTYVGHSPAFAVKQVRGMLDRFGDEIDMSSFTYFSPSATNVPGNGMPQTAQEYYRLLTGTWRDGTPMTLGGTGFNLGSNQETTYAFSGLPNQLNSWSMCSAGILPSDQQFVMSSGPFRLDPGAINEAVYGLYWSDYQEYPCPDLLPLLGGVRETQCTIDDCFGEYIGPDAPDVLIQEKDKKLVMTLSNSRVISNNFLEEYNVVHCEAIANKALDSTYTFEGYFIFQLISENVGFSELRDTNLSKVVASVDIQNGVKEVFNWKIFKSNFIDSIDLTPQLMNPGAQDQGIPDSIVITKDLFATGIDRSLKNNQAYFYTVIAYAYNNYAPLEIVDGILKGQHKQFLQSRWNVQTYKATPHQGLVDCGNPNNELKRKLSVKAGPNPYVLSQDMPLRLIGVPAKSTITIYDSQGRFQNRFNLQGQPCLDFIYTLEDKDFNGGGLSAGIYLIKIDAPGYDSQTLKLLIFD